MKAEFNNDKKTKRRKTLFFCLFLAAVIGSAVIFASKAAEQTGLYWIGADNEKIAETPEDNRGFFTVDISDFLRNAGALSAEAADKAENTEVVPLAIGPLPSVPTLTDDELKLYGVLSQNNGEITSGDKDLLDDGIHWTEVVLEPGETLKSIAEEFNISEEDLRMANGLKKNQKPSMTEVLFVPNSHEDVMSTILFVRKLQHEDLLLAKKGKPLNVIDYYVKEGDTLWKIANKFDLDIDTLVASNRQRLGGNINRLKPGLKMRIPNQNGVFVRVGKKDTLDSLAYKYGSSKEAVMTANMMTNEKLAVGNEIFLPGGKVIAASEPAVKTKRSIFGGRTKTAKASSGSVRGGSRLRWPLSGRLSSRFGWRKSPFGRRRVFHSGLDIPAPRGTVIRAANSGTVVHAGWMGGYGRTVVIAHSKGITTLYGHCSKLLVRSGSRVSQGQSIARVGSTGRSTGNHLHFEVRVNGSARNPFKYLK